MVTPLGVGVDHNWREITAGKSGICKVSGFDVSDITSQVAGVVPRAVESSKDGRFFADDYVAVKEQKKMDDFIIYAMAAAKEAIADSGWIADTEEKQWRTGVLIGAGIGGLSTIYETTTLMVERGPRRISPFFIPAALINLTSGC